MSKTSPTAERPNTTATGQNWTARMVTDIDDASALTEVLGRIWGAPGMDADLVVAIAFAGNYAMVAEQDGAPVGGALGFFGPPAAATMHSHVVGVESTARGLGRYIKWHQAKWCLERGVETMTWTFDPLVRRNAYFNFSVLGAGASQYLVDHYGDMPDAINTGQGSDRLLIRWDLTSLPMEPPGAAVELDQRSWSTVPALLEPDAANAPKLGPALEGSHARIRIPADIEAMRSTDPEAALRWRLAVREQLFGVLADGWKIAGVSREGDYLLAK